METTRNSLPVGSNFSRRRPGTQSSRTGYRKTGGPAGLTPRPASIIGDVSEHEENPDHIGRAITKDFSGLKRRSQSLSALAITAKFLHAEPSRLSGELRCWRDSYETQNTSSVYSRHPDVQGQEWETEKNSEPPPMPVVEAFDFPHVSAMKITEAATLESRIRNLEQKTDNLERIVGGLNNGIRDLSDTPSVLLQAQNPNPSQRSGAAPSTSSSYVRGGDEPESGKPLSRHGSRSRGTSKSSTTSGDDSVFDTQPAVTSSSRPLSTSTIRATTNLPSTSQDTSRPLTMDHYTTLMALLDTERSARWALEDKVKLLSHQISVISKSAARVREANGLGSSSPSFGSVFDYDDEEDDHASNNRIRRRAKTGKTTQSRGPRTNAGEQKTMAALDDNDHDDGYSSTSYTTTHGDETDDEIDMVRKKTGRTLSLSQMTMKKPQP